MERTTVRGHQVWGGTIDTYHYEWVRGLYVIRRGRDPVLTPAGNPFATGYEGLAALVCADMDRYGPDPLNSLSYVTLHASYTDFGSAVPKHELIRVIIADYASDWDVALKQLSQSDTPIVWSSGTHGSERPSVRFDSLIYFGPREHPSTIHRWLEGLSVRALCSVQVCVGAFHSVHIPYRLLDSYSPVPPSTLARGIVSLTNDIHPFFYAAEDPQGAEQRIIAFLEKIKVYASFADEKIS